MGNSKGKLEIMNLVKMNEQCILIHYHEIGLKGDNRSWFEKIFINNIKRQLQNLPYSSIKIIAARIFVFDIESNLCEEYNNCLKNVMGLKHAFIIFRLCYSFVRYHIFVTC